MMAEAARYNVERGAQIIDINMGCPAKKVCNVAAGSALLQNEPLVARIVEAVVAAVAEVDAKVPVTLKIPHRLEPREPQRAARGARPNAGISMLTIHGRTRADLYHGEAEYETIAAVKAQAGIPIVANGDITRRRRAGAGSDRRRRADDRPRGSGDGGCSARSSISSPPANCCRRPGGRDPPS